MKDASVPAAGAQEERPPRDAALVVNTHSRRGRRLFADAQAGLAARGFRLRESHAVHDPGGLLALVQRLVREGVSLEVEAALDVIAAGEVQTADLGRLAYGLAGLRSLTMQDPFTLRLIADGRRLEVVTRQAVVANGRFHAGRELAEGADVASGRLLVYVMEGGSGWKVLKGHAAYLAGFGERLSETILLTARELYLVADPAQRIEVDGEVKARTPIQVAAAPGALKVLAPRDDPASA